MTDFRAVVYIYIYIYIYIPFLFMCFSKILDTVGRIEIGL